MLTALRSSEVQLPGDGDQVTRPQQTYLIQWLLSHDPVSRQVPSFDWSMLTILSSHWSQYHLGSAFEVKYTSKGSF